MIGKVAPIMTFEMLMRKYFDEQRPGTMDAEPEFKGEDESVPWAIPGESKMEEVESPSNTLEND